MENNMNNRPNRNETGNVEHRTPPRAARPIGSRPNSVRPNMARHVNQNVNHRDSMKNAYDDTVPIPKRDSIVDVDAENENYFINSVGYDELVDDETTLDMDKAEEKAKSKQKTPEQLKRRKIIAISAGSAGVLLLAGLVTATVLRSDPGVTINKVDITGHEPVYVAESQTDDTQTTTNYTTSSEASTSSEMNTETSDTQETTEGVEEKRVNRVYSIITPESGKEYNVGSFITKKFQVNSKPVGADEYVVSNTKYDCGLEKIYTGDEVEKIIQNYNDTNTSNMEVSIDFGSITDSTFVIARVGCQYPDDYPTSDGKAYEVPQVSLKVVGTYTEPETELKANSGSTYTDKVAVGDKIYTLTDPIEVFDAPSSISVAPGYNYDYLIQLPSGAKADSYKLIVTIDGQEIVYNGIDVD